MDKRRVCEFTERAVLPRVHRRRGASANHYGNQSQQTLLSLGISSGIQIGRVDASMALQLNTFGVDLKDSIVGIRSRTGLQTRKQIPPEKQDG